MPITKRKSIFCHKLVFGSGLDGVEILKSVAGAPPRPDGDPDSFQLRILAQSLMVSRDWKQRLEKMSAIQLPIFHR